MSTGHYKFLKLQQLCQPVDIRLNRPGVTSRPAPGPRITSGLSRYQRFRWQRRYRTAAVMPADGLHHRLHAHTRFAVGIETRHVAYTSPISRAASSRCTICSLSSCHFQRNGRCCRLRNEQAPAIHTYLVRFNVVTRFTRQNYQLRITSLPERSSRGSGSVKPCSTPDPPAR